MTTEQDDNRVRSAHWLAWLIPLTIAAAAIGITAGGLFPLLSLRYERTGIESGELWRLFTGHFTHLNWNHLLMNLGGLALIWLLFGQRLGVTHWLILIVSCTAAISAGLWLLHPDIGWYVGLSGVLHGMFVAGALGGLYAGYRAEWLLLGLVSLKLAWEQIAGALPGTESMAGGAVVVDAHLYGALTGLVVAILLRALLPLPEWRQRPF